ncbi:ribonuclease T2 [Chelatococcus sp. SYSU_G07232]|uniref:Ribonuclease T2 n=1 Tax=Chelatococcus albus TaxID=3047466 RepID=A0ABT7AIR4_9HYPH|nr:ribonuclease T2 [Chelatococcus sp. SYSU_G07232]MDJ1159275.1 ribonuclease T2 [Chelatococcus sp. SYSU_G07232]
MSYSRLRTTPIGFAVALLAIALGITPAVAQPRGAEAGVQKGATAGQFDFYVLALSWSPGFCTLEGDARNRDQCETGARLGFVVHGLWPQYERGYPVECEPMVRTPSRLALDTAKGLYPDEGLARYQWRKHGTCSGKSPTDYFADVRKAREAIVLPPAFEKPDGDQNWTPLDLERAFAAANPGLRPDMMSVSCRRGVLQEVRICFSKDLRGFRICPELDRTGCRGGMVKVEAPR